MQIIYLDISNKGVVPTIYAKQGDIGRKIQVIFTDSGIPYKIPENAELSVWYEGDSGDGNYTDIGDKSAIVVENNKVTFELITQMLNNDGEGIVCLIMNVGEEQIGSWNIHYSCEKVPGFDSEGASSYFTAFSESVNKLKNTDKTLTKEGYPADAKATGDKIDNLTAEDIGAAPVSDWRGTFTGNIDNTKLNGLYWLSSGFTGTVPADMSQYAFIDASARHQRLMYFGNSGITKIYERYYTNNKWYEWVQTDAINLLESIYPIGSIYMSVTNKSPASFLGGTWAQLKDRFLLGAGSSYTNGSTGGASTVTLTVDQMPSHGHNIYDDTDERLVGPYGGGDSGSHGITYSHAGRSNTLMASVAGGGKSHNNMPPYLVVYMWKRTA